MNVAFSIGALLGVLGYIILCIKHEYDMKTYEGIFALIFYAVFCGWFAAFFYKLIQWPFM